MLRHHQVCGKNLTDIMVDQEDAKYLIEMRKEYKNIVRNLWDPFDKNYESVIGCNTVNRMYITPLGDVLSCPYVHIKIGNVYENTLKRFQNMDLVLKDSENIAHCVLLVKTRVC